MSQSTTQIALYVGAILSFVAALLHFSCMFIGAPAFRFLGAGEALARMSEEGHWYPSVVAFVIGAVLVGWAAYALSGAGVYHLPFTQYALAAIAVIYLARAVAFPFLKPVFPENSQLFWLVSSGICLIMGFAYLIGALGVWEK